MTEPAPAAPPPAAAVPTPSPAPPLLLWSAVNVAALAAAAWRVNLTARYPQPAELLAVHVTLITQVIAAGVLFPVLARTTSAAICVAASVFPFAALAALLSGRPVSATLSAAAFVAVWVAALAALNHALRTPPARLAGVAAANLLTIGEPLLHYLGHEFGRAPGFSAGPTLHVLAMVEGRWEKVGGWVLVAVLLATALISSRVNWRRGDVEHSRQPSPAQ